MSKQLGLFEEEQTKPIPTVEVTIYTDGAASPNPGNGGWGAILICEAKNQRREISGGWKNATNNQMELQAAIEGLKALKKPCKVTLITDSKYVCNAFAQNWIGNWQRNNWYTAGGTQVKNQDQWQQLLELSKTHTIEWKWVKGHNGHPENERCDELAVAAANALKITN